MIAAQLLASVEEKWTEKRGSLVGLQRREGASGMQHCVGRQILDCPIQKKYGTDARRLDQVPFRRRIQDSGMCDKQAGEDSRYD